MANFKITVLKRSLFEDLAQEYVETERKKTYGPCEIFKEGQEFIVDFYKGPPERFCSWAWEDITKPLLVLKQVVSLVCGIKIKTPLFLAVQME